MSIWTRVGKRERPNTRPDATDPAKQLDRILFDLEEQRKAALAELLSYRATAKQMERDLEELTVKQLRWEKRAMIAIKREDENAAKEFLREKLRVDAAIAGLARDRDEAAGYALELNRSRKQVETQLRILRLKKGTMASQLAVARSGKSSFSAAEALSEEFDRAEQAIEQETLDAEVAALLEDEFGDGSRACSQSQLEAGDSAGFGDEGDEDDPLVRLKARMAESQALHKNGDR